MRFWHFTNSKSAFDHDWNVLISVVPPSAMDHFIYAFGAGAPVPDEVRASVTVSAQRELPDVIVSGFGMLAKRGICEAVHEAFGDAAQIIPVDTENEFLPGYACINITQRFECVDVPRSDVVMHPGDPETLMAIKKLWIKSDRIPGSPVIFRISEFRPMVLVDEPAMQRLQACGVSHDCFSDLLLGTYNAAQGH